MARETTTPDPPQETGYGHATTGDSQARPAPSTRAAAIDDAVIKLLFANARAGEIITVGVAATLALTQWPDAGTSRTIL